MQNRKYGHIQKTVKEEERDDLEEQRSSSLQGLSQQTISSGDCSSMSMSKEDYESSTFSTNTNDSHKEQELRLAAEDRVAKLYNKISNMDHKLAASEEQCRSERKTKQEVQAKIVKLESSERRLTLQLKTARKSKTEAETKLTKMLDRMSQMNHKLASTEEKLKTALQVHKRVSETNVAQASEIKQLTGKMKMAEKKLQKNKEEMKALKVENESNAKCIAMMRELVEQKETEICARAKQLRILQEDRKKDLGRSKKRVDKQVMLLEQRVQEKDKRIAQLKDEQRTQQKSLATNAVQNKYLLSSLEKAREQCKKECSQRMAAENKVRALRKKAANSSQTSFSQPLSVVRSKPGPRSTKKSKEGSVTTSSVASWTCDSDISHDTESKTAAEGTNPAFEGVMAHINQGGSTLGNSDVLATGLEGTKKPPGASEVSRPPLKLQLSVDGSSGKSDEDFHSQETPRHLNALSCQKKDDKSSNKVTPASRREPQSQVIDVVPMKQSDETSQGLESEDGTMWTSSTQVGCLGESKVVDTDAPRETQKGAGEGLSNVPEDKTKKVTARKEQEKEPTDLKKTQASELATQAASHEHNVPEDKTKKESQDKQKLSARKEQQNEPTDLKETQASELATQAASHEHKMMTAEPPDKKTTTKKEIQINHPCKDDSSQNGKVVKSVPQTTSMPEKIRLYDGRGTTTEQNKIVPDQPTQGMTKTATCIETLSSTKPSQEEGNTCNDISQDEQPEAVGSEEDREKVVVATGKRVGDSVSADKGAPTGISTSEKQAEPEIKYPDTIPEEIITVQEQQEILHSLTPRKKQSEESLLANVPIHIKSMYQEVGFYKDRKLDTHFPVLCLQPFSMPPGPAQVQALGEPSDFVGIYIYGKTSFMAAYQSIKWFRFIPYDTAVRKGFNKVPASLQAIVENNGSLSGWESELYKGLQKIDEEASKAASDRTHLFLQFQSKHTSWYSISDTESAESDISALNQAEAKMGPNQAGVSGPESGDSDIGALNQAAKKMRPKQAGEKLGVKEKEGQGAADKRAIALDVVDQQEETLINSSLADSKSMPMESASSLLKDPAGDRAVSKESKACVEDPEKVIDSLRQCLLTGCPSVAYSNYENESQDVVLNESLQKVNLVSNEINLALDCTDSGGRESEEEEYDPFVTFQQTFSKTRESFCAALQQFSSTPLGTPANKPEKRKTKKASKPQDRDIPKYIVAQKMEGSDECVSEMGDGFFPTLLDESDKLILLLQQILGEDQEEELQYDLEKIQSMLSEDGGLEKVQSFLSSRSRDLFDTENYPTDEVTASNK